MVAEIPLRETRWPRAFRNDRQFVCQPEPVASEGSRFFIKQAGHWILTQFAGLLLLAAPAFAQAPGAASDQERGVGPFSMKTAQGSFIVRLLWRDKGTVWVRQQTQAGAWVQAGIPAADIVWIETPRPRAFDLAAQAATPEQIGQVRPLLAKLFETLRPYRDLPGMVADEARVWQARLAERQNLWAEAVAGYEDILRQPYRSTQADAAKLRAGLAYFHLGQKDKALEYLTGAPTDENDLELLSAVYFARAQALAAAGRHAEAIKDFLYLVVFHPYTQNNEPRCLEAVLPSYAALQDWDALAKGWAALRLNYPEAAETKRAEALMKNYTKETEREQQYKIAK